MKHRLLGNTGVKVSELSVGGSIYPHRIIKRQNAGGEPIKTDQKLVAVRR